MRHDSIICVTWLISICNTTHFYAWQQLMAKMDLDGNGIIDFEEFENWYHTDYADSKKGGSVYVLCVCMCAWVSMVQCVCVCVWYSICLYVGVGVFVWMTAWGFFEQLFITHTHTRTQRYMYTHTCIHAYAHANFNLWVPTRIRTKEIVSEPATKHGSFAKDPYQTALFFKRTLQSSALCNTKEPYKIGFFSKRALQNRALLQTSHTNYDCLQKSPINKALMYKNFFFLRSNQTW